MADSPFMISFIARHLKEHSKSEKKSNGMEFMNEFLWSAVWMIGMRHRALCSGQVAFRLVRLSINKAISAQLNP